MMVESSQEMVTGGAQLGEVHVEGSATGFAQTITVGGHQLLSDEPTASGGTDTGPGPYDFLLAALGSCTSMTIALYARRKQWPLESVRGPRRARAVFAVREAAVGPAVPAR